MNKTELNKRIEAGINYRFSTISRSVNTDSFKIEGYATTFNEPYILGENENFRVLEQISDRAFDECDLSDCIMQYDHEGKVFARTTNNTLKLSIDEHGLKVEADLSGTEEGRKLYQEIKGGYITKMSFGFTIGEEEEIQRTGTDGKIEFLQTVQKIKKLYDVSVVSIPANDSTVVSARKKFDAAVPTDSDLRKRLLLELEAIL